MPPPPPSPPLPISLIRSRVPGRPVFPGRSGGPNAVGEPNRKGNARDPLKKNSATRDAANIPRSSSAAGSSDREPHPSGRGDWGCISASPSTPAAIRPRSPRPYRPPSPPAPPPPAPDPIRSPLHAALENRNAQTRPRIGTLAGGREAAGAHAGRALAGCAHRPPSRVTSAPSVHFASSVSLARARGPEQRRTHRDHQGPAWSFRQLSSHPSRARTQQCQGAAAPWSGARSSHADGASGRKRGRKEGLGAERRERQREVPRLQTNQIHPNPAVRDNLRCAIDSRGGSCARRSGGAWRVRRESVWRGGGGGEQNE